MRSSIAARKLSAAIVAVVALGLAAPAIAGATTYAVNTTSDTNAVDPTVSANDSSGHISLRSALEALNTTPGTNDSITVPAGSYTLTASGGAGQGTAGALVVSDANGVTITGAGASTTTIDAAEIDRAFRIDPGTIKISGLTIENGRAGPDVVNQPSPCPTLPGGVTDPGGAILDQGTLTLTDDTFTGNMSEGSGGAVEDQGGVLTVGGSTFNGNTACQGDSGTNTGVGNGGAIDEASLNDVSIDSSTISDNSAQADGGGLAETSIPDPTMTVTNSTISGNHADGSGGGMVGEGGGTIDLFADLLNGNTATQEGGGIGGNDTDQVTNSTITGNFAGCPGDVATCAQDTGGSGDGGGIDTGFAQVTISFSTINGNYAVGGNGGNLEDCGDCGSQMTLDDSIVTGGIADGGPNNCDGFGFTSNGHNLFDDDGTDCSAIGSDLTNANPRLGTLANNGGPTETEALGHGSQALDAADDSLCASETLNSSQQPVDQRGVTRPQGPHCDIGAFEAASGGGGGGGKTTGTLSTTVFDSATHAAWTGTETAGASAYDTTNLGGTVAGQTPTGSVTYRLFSNGICSGDAAEVDTKPLNSDGSVPSSDPSGGLAAGSYSYQVSWGGDANYTPSTGPCEAFTVQPGQPDLTLNAAPETNPIVMGEQDTVTDTVKNVGGGDATDVNFTDPAAGFQINRVTSSQGTCTHTATTVSCSLGTIGAGHSAKVQILLSATSVGAITLHSSVSMAQPDPTPGNDHATATIRVNPHVNPVADLAATVTPSARRVAVGHTVSFSLLVTNHGPDAGHQVSVTDRLPGDVELVGVHAGRHVPCHTAGGETITCALGTLRRGATRRIRLQVRAEQAGLAVDTAQVTDASPTDPNLTNNHDRTAVTISASALPSVGVNHLGAACHAENSGFAIDVTVVATAGIRSVLVRIGGHVVKAYRPASHTIQRQRLVIRIRGPQYVPGRSYPVVIALVDALGRSVHTTRHFTVCQPAPRKRGFTG